MMPNFSLAYIEPGSGSLLIQVIIATILAVPYFLRMQICRAINAIRGREKPAARAGLLDHELPSIAG